MRRVSVAAIVLVLAIPAESAAHRLDEYLQAARVSLEGDRVTLEIDLTPGVNIAAAIVTLLDRNGDGTISTIEAEAYGKRVLSDVVLALDGCPIAMTLTRVEIPAPGDISDGLGTIQLHAVGQVESLAAGRRQLYFRNNHQPVASTYLVNALLPQDGDVGVVIQARDPRQQTVRVEYEVGPRWPAQLLWLVLGAAGLTTLIGLRSVQNCLL
jgi:hypothetical protein